jgi:hypothetical protein
VPTLHLCVLRESQNKQQLLPYKTVSDWFLQPKWKVFTARYALSPYIKQIRFVFKGLNNPENPGGTVAYRLGMTAVHHQYKYQHLFSGSEHQTYMNRSTRTAFTVCVNFMNFLEKCLINCGTFISLRHYCVSSYTAASLLCLNMAVLMHNSQRQISHTPHLWITRQFKWMEEHGLHISGAGQAQVAGSFQRGNDTLGSTTCGEFLD